jgi:hypothetical protein
MDDLLDQLSKQPVHPALDRMDAFVLARIATQNTRSALRQLQLGIAAATLAIAMGVAGGELGQTRAEAAASLSPLGPASPLAPSTLLASRE